MEVMLAKAMKISTATPRTGPPKGTIQTVGSESPSVSAAAMPTTCAISVATRSPP